MLGTLVLCAVLSTSPAQFCPPACLQTAQLPLKADGVEARVVHKQLLGFIQRSDPRCAPDCAVVAEWT